MNTHAPECFNVFIAYAREDEDLQRKLLKHLSPLKREGLISPWFDRCINAGTEWERQIREQLEAADIFLLLISASFIASEYCYGVEMTRAMERHESKDAIVIPVILRDADWSRAPFAKLQALPLDARPVTSWPNTDQALASVARGLRSAIADLITRLEQRHPQTKPLPKLDLLSQKPTVPPLER